MGTARRTGLRRALIAVLVLSLALVAAACGDDDEGATTTGAAETTAGTEPTGEPIKVGADLPLTGAYAADGEHMKYGLELAVADLNAAGGLLGRPVELVVYDIEDLLPETIAAARDYLIDREAVDVVVQGYADYMTDFEVFGAGSEVPFLHGSGSVRSAQMVADDPETYANMFQVFPVEADYGGRAWDGITQFEDDYVYPNNKIAILHGDLEWDLNYTAGVAAKAEEAGWEVVMNETFPYGTTDWGSILTQIRSEEPAVIVCSVLSVADISSFVLQFMEDPTPSLLDISYMVVFTEVQDAVGDDLIGVMGYVTSFVTPGVEHDAWKARFEEMFGMEVPLTTPPSTYDEVMIWAEAVEAVGDPTAYAEVSEYIRTHPYTGLLGVYDFDNPEQTVKYGPDFQIAYAQYQGDGQLAFFGTDEFFLPPWIDPPWEER